MIRYFTILLIVFSASTTYAQRFNAGIALGLNAAQVNGDDSAGFNKLGLQGGLRATTHFTDKFDMVLEILYSQRGSQTELVPGNANFQRKIKANYIEVPVLASYKDWYDEDDDYYKIDFFGGLSYGYLIDIKLVDFDFVIDEKFFTKNDISFIIGATYNLNSHWGFSFRYTRSLNYLLNPDNNPLNTNPYLGYFLNFRAQYMF